MISSRNKKIILAVLLIAACLVAAAMQIWGSVKPEKTEIHYFYDGVCGSCDYEREFVDLFNDKLAGVKNKAEFSLIMHNTFTVGETTAQKLYNKYNIPKEAQNTPLLIIGSQYLYTQDEIETNIRKVFCEEFQIEDSNILTYYFRPECKDCTRIADFFNETMAEHPDIKFEKIDTTDEIPKQKFKDFLAEIAVPTEEWQVPFVYYQGKYLSGDKEIESKLEDLLK